MKIAELFWTVRVALLVCGCFRWSPAECWNLAVAVGENSYGEMSPRDAFNSELSHWEA